ncbi:MAG: TonB-dependent receptor [Candidatus Andeanibacterium colombiense]|uniref:TonB-dependent receptor n=1 Tax=Candidatus Andeanibacterium colombiense TaxID=3121345 RepID=A0AAJ6BPC4_9SPHN|nr:MAG: TonB-dependent receptor [Sphingomonadaceae bacterium]
MNRQLVMRALLKGVSLSAIVPATLVCAPAFAQSDSADSAAAPAADAAPADKSPADDIIVTGTRIRGVAPVGSAVVQLDQEAMTKTGQLSTADILAKVPSVLSLGSGNSYSGGSTQGTSDLNALSFNKSPNLRGFGPQATLSLVNGHRVPYDGAAMNTFDGDNIPVQMLQRIDIVADGTSANYGADAISGTVNYVMRAPFTGLEVYGQYGTADGQDSWQGTAVGGYDWGSGGIVVSYQHAHSDRLKASARPDLYNDDFSPYGGPSSSIYSSLGNIVYNGNTYALPSGQDGSNVTLAQIGAAGTANTQNVWTGYDAIPRFKRDQVAANFRQEVVPGVEIYADGFYSKRDYDLALFSTAVNNRNLLTVPNSNYYSPCNHDLTGASADLLAACSAGSLTVAYNNVGDGGPGTRSGFTRTWDATGGIKVDLFGNWRANAYASFGKSFAHASNTLYFGNGLDNNPVLAAALALGTPDAFNPFCDGTALDCGNGQYAGDIFAGNTFDIDTTYKSQDYALNLDGSLFALPGGDVRLAVGGEYLKAKFINANSFGATVNRRSIKSGYGELFVPIFGAANAVSGIHRLELTAAIRADDYSDVGTTVNPKLGLNWAPTDWLKFRGSYGTSFRAPTLVDNDPYSQTGYIPAVVSGDLITADCTGCGGSDITIYQALGGAAGNLKPESSTSWSLGLDIVPPSSGVNISVTYWNTKYTGQVSTPVYNVGTVQAINLGYYDSGIIYNPSYFPDKAANNPVAFFGPFPINSGNADCVAVNGQAITSQGLYDQMIGCINAGGTQGPVLGLPSSDVAAVTNGHRLNAGSTHADGIDVAASYDWAAGANAWHIGVIGSYINSWKVSPLPGAPVIDQVNKFGYPLRFRGRLDGSWSRDVGPGSLTLAGYVNYANGYTIDPVLLPTGLTGDYTHIASYTTVDLAVHYDFDDQDSVLLKGLSFTISAQNVFDRGPPLVINSSNTASIRFDPSNASPLGRVVQLQVAKKF